MLRVTRDRPPGVFQGHNFMTPDVLSYHVIGPDFGQVWAELSKGRGICGEPIFGVTVRKSNGERLEPDQSRLFHNLEEATGYIESLP